MSTYHNLKNLGICVFLTLLFATYFLICPTYTSAATIDLCDEVTVIGHGSSPNDRLSPDDKLTLQYKTNVDVNRFDIHLLNSNRANPSDRMMNQNGTIYSYPVAIPKSKSGTVTYDWYKLYVPDYNPALPDNFKGLAPFEIRLVAYLANESDVNSADALCQPTVYFDTLDNDTGNDVSVCATATCEYLDSAGNVINVCSSNGKLNYNPSLSGQNDKVSITVYGHSNVTLEDMIIGLYDNDPKFVSVNGGDSFGYIAPPADVIQLNNKSSQFNLNLKIPYSLLSQAVNNGNATGNAVFDAIKNSPVHWFQGNIWIREAKGHNLIQPKNCIQQFVNRRPPICGKSYIISHYRQGTLIGGGQDIKEVTLEPGDEIVVRTETIKTVGPMKDGHETHTTKNINSSVSTISTNTTKTLTGLYYDTSTNNYPRTMAWNQLAGNGITSMVFSYDELFKNHANLNATAKCEGVSIDTSFSRWGGPNTDSSTVELLSASNPACSVTVLRNGCQNPQPSTAPTSIPQPTALPTDAPDCEKDLDAQCGATATGGYIYCCTSKGLTCSSLGAGAPNMCRPIPTSAPVVPTITTLPSATPTDVPGCTSEVNTPCGATATTAYNTICCASKNLACLPTGKNDEKACLPIPTGSPTVPPITITPIKFEPKFETSCLGQDFDKKLVTKVITPIDYFDTTLPIDAYTLKLKRELEEYTAKSVQVTKNVAVFSPWDTKLLPGKYSVSMTYKVIEPQRATEITIQYGDIDIPNCSSCDNAEVGFIFDRSGSMRLSYTRNDTKPPRKETYLETEKLSFISFVDYIETLGKAVNIGVITFPKSDLDYNFPHPEGGVDFTKFNPTNILFSNQERNDIATIRTTIQNIKTSQPMNGGFATCLECALNRARLGGFYNANTAIKILVLVSDGETNLVQMTKNQSLKDTIKVSDLEFNLEQAYQKGSGKSVDYEFIINRTLQAAERMKTSGIKIYSIGYGDARNDLMQKIATTTGGKYYLATDPSNWDDRLSDVAKNICTEKIHTTRLSMVN